MATKLVPAKFSLNKNKDLRCNSYNHSMEFTDGLKPKVPLPIQIPEREQGEKNR
jgi:hypothetical protein